MTAISVTGDALSVELQGIDRLFALTPRLTIPLDHVVSVEPTPARGGGSRLAAVMAGIGEWMSPRAFYQRAGRNWFAPVQPERAVEVRLWNERYERLLLMVDDPQEVASMVRGAVRHTAEEPD